MATLPKITIGMAILFAMIRTFSGGSPAGADGSSPAAPASKPAAVSAKTQSSSRTASRPSPPRFALRFTAPSDAPKPDSSRAAGGPLGPVRGYQFIQLDELGVTTVLQGYADSLGSRILTPHESGTLETVWLEPTDPARAKTIFVLSHGWSGHSSSWSNGVGIAAVLHPSGGDTRAARNTVRAPAVAHPQGSGEATEKR